jgi:hydroxypyruvate reductase
VITKYGHGLESLPYELIESGHPYPDDRSLEAGRRLLGFIDSAPSQTDWLFLISGGASSLVEALPEGMTLETLRRANQWLLGSGLSIAQMNRVRKGLSLIKGGRLAHYLAGRTVQNLLISDVPGDDPATIGSGLLVAEPDSGVLPAGLPDWLLAALERMPEAPAADAPCFATITSRLLAGNHTALEAAARRAAELGLAVHRHEQALACPVEEAAGRVLSALASAPGLHLFGGETTVVLPPEHGRGGRNQHLALLLAQAIAGTNDEVLCAGTDGSDGETGDAGALVDGGTVERGDPEYPGGIQAALWTFDAGRYLEASGDLIRTGPTGTNVMDLVLAWRAP